MSQRVKIVATLGPASSSAEQIAALRGAGVDVFRVNASHGSHEEHAERIAHVRAATGPGESPSGILLDLQGPKIRTGSLEGGGPVELVAGRPFSITSRSVPRGMNSVIRYQRPSWRTWSSTRATLG